MAPGDGTGQNDVRSCAPCLSQAIEVIPAGSIVCDTASERVGVATCRRGTRRFFGLRPGQMLALGGGAWMAVAEGCQRNLGRTCTREPLAEAGRRPGLCA